MPYNAVIFLPLEKSPLLQDSLINNLREVFGEALSVRICHDALINHSFADQMLNQADLVLLLSSDCTRELTDRLTHPEKSVILTRTLKKSSLPLLEEIPPGEAVLVVNHGLTLTTELLKDLQTTAAMPNRLIPYEPDKKPEKIYQNIRYAVCPNEKALVPSFITHIIDLGERKIDVYSMIQIASVLGIHSLKTEQNLYQYSLELSGPETVLARQHYYNYLSSTLLKEYLQTTEEGLIFFDTNYEVLYVNTYMKRFFPVNPLPSLENIQEIFPGLTDPDFYSGVQTIDGEHYVITKKNIWVEKRTAGWVFTIRDEKSIHDINEDLSAKLISKGMVAKHHFEDIIYHSAPMERVVRLARQSAVTDYPILIEGESGTGKELFAQSIHNTSARRFKPFLAINCASLSADLLESELFGYEEGSFTGASRHGKSGLFEQANGGTLFLDEIGDMPLSMQALLLRAIQENQIRRIGGTKLISVNVRIIGATNHDLYTESRTGRFRLDLYYRLNTLPLHIPALRDRPEDIPVLLKYFLKKDWKRMPPEELNYLKSLPWPGNIRQLQNFCNYYKTLHTIQGFFHTGEDRTVSLPPETAGMIPTDELILQSIRQYTTASHGIGQNALLRVLAEKGIHCSDAWLRKILHQWEGKSFITIGRGRMGCRITEKGKAFLAAEDKN